MTQPTRLNLLSLLAGYTLDGTSELLTLAPISLAVGANNGLVVEMPTVTGRASAIQLVGVITGAGATIDGKIQESANGVSGFADLAAFAQVLASGNAQRIQFNHTQKFLRYVGTVGGPGGTAILAAASIHVSGDMMVGDGYVGLYSNAAIINPDLTLADLTECTYPGYARQLAVWRVPHLIDDDVPVVRAEDLEFKPNAAVVPPEAANGWFLVSASVAGTLLWVESFGTPFIFGDTFDSKTVIPAIQLPPDSDFGNSTELD